MKRKKFSKKHCKNLSKVQKYGILDKIKILKRAIKYLKEKNNGQK